MLRCVIAYYKKNIKMRPTFTLTRLKSNSKVQDNLFYGSKIK